MAISIRTFEKTYPEVDYFPAVADTYQAGQTLTLNASGKLAASGAIATTPQYISETDAVVSATADDGSHVAEGGNVIGVHKPQRDIVYTAPLNAAIAALAAGQKLSIAADGLSLAAAAGTFEVTQISGTGAGSLVSGRFV